MPRGGAIAGAIAGASSSSGRFLQKVRPVIFRSRPSLYPRCTLQSAKSINPDHSYASFPSHAPLLFRQVPGRQLDGGHERGAVPVPVPLPRVRAVQPVPPGGRGVRGGQGDAPQLPGGGERGVLPRGDVRRGGGPLVLRAVRARDAGGGVLPAARAQRLRAARPARHSELWASTDPPLPSSTDPRAGGLPRPNGCSPPPSPGICRRSSLCPRGRVFVECPLVTSPFSPGRLFSGSARLKLVRRTGPLEDRKRRQTLNLQPYLFYLPGGAFSLQARATCEVVCASRTRAPADSPGSRCSR